MVVTVVLALLFLGERIGPIECAGIVLAIVAAVALSREAGRGFPIHYAPP